MQYFAALVGEGEGTENRVTYGEAVSDEAGALALVGTERINRVIAGAFFGDPSRLQKDVLGDAVEQRLKTLELPNQRART